MLPVASNNGESSHLKKANSNDLGEQLPQVATTDGARLPSCFVIQLTSIASLGGVLFGYDLGVISTALPQLIDTFDLTSSQQELAVSILYLGGGIGAALGGSLCDAFGRKRAILITDTVFFLGAFILYAAPNFGSVVVGRIVVGFGIAVSGIADVSYLNEIAPVQFRGAIVSVNEACISMGFLLAFGVGSALSAEGKSEGWRTMFGISGLVALIQFVGMLRLPESPKWLKERGRHEESEIAMQQIGGDYSLASPHGEQTANVHQVYDSTTSATDSVDNDSQSAVDLSTEITTSLQFSVGDIIQRICTYFRQILYLAQQLQTFATQTAERYRRQAYITLFLAVTQQLCGQTNVLSYAPLIFAGASSSGQPSSAFVQGWSTLSIGLVKFAVTVVVIWKIESLGRRFLLLFGMGTIALGLLLLVIAFGITDVSQATNAPEDAPRGGFYLALPGVLLVVWGYSMSFGPLTWLLTSELFPTDIRGRALGTSTIITYLCALLVTYTFLTAQAWVGASAVFAFYLLVTFLGMVFVFLAIPETGGKTAEEIGQDLESMRWWRRNSEGSWSPLAGSNFRLEAEIT
jgi:MFS family permease